MSDRPPAAPCPPPCEVIAFPRAPARAPQPAPLVPQAASYAHLADVAVACSQALYSLCNSLAVVQVELQRLVSQRVPPAPAPAPNAAPRGPSALPD